MAKVFVKMVPHPSAQKKKHFIKDPKGRKDINMTKAQGKNGMGIFRFVVSQTRNGLLNTNLDKKIDNPWKDKPNELPSNWRTSGLETKEVISKQEYFEVKLNQKPGELTSIPKKIFDKDSSMPYLQKLYKDFEDTTLLDLDEPKDELIYWLLLASHADKCANSWEERSNFSRLYISKVNEDEVRVAKKLEIVENAISDLVTLKNDYSESDIIKIAVVLKLIKGETSISKVKNTLSEHISKQSSNQLENIEAFNELFKSLNNAKDREMFEAKYLLQACINNRIISDYKGKYTWNSKKGTSLETLGKSYKEAVQTILDIDWRNYREELADELKTKVDDNRSMAF